VELVVERAAALDVGKDEVVACIRVPDPAGGGRRRRRQEVRTYPTFTSSLETLADWLQAEGVTQVVMEATGQYWKPIWYVLEERGFQLLLVNARHVKILPGRKTDVGDAAWLCELLECGLLRGSFVPPPAIRQLRDLTRYRKRLIQTHGAECQRIQKTLEDAGIKQGLGRHRRAGRVGPGDAGGPGRRRARPQDAGGAGQGQAAQEAPPAAPGAARPLRRPPRPAGRAGP
jgi:transposase